jgi:hypothetical protein
VWQLVELPGPERAALDLNIEHVGDAVGVRLVGALGARMVLQPALEVVAEPLWNRGRPVEDVQGFVDRPLRVAL